jgi:hypothetical protein
MRHALALPLALLAGLAVAGCNTTAQTPPPPTSAPVSPVTPPGFTLPDGAGCSGAVARFRAIQDNDLAMGHVGRKVYDQIKGEIAQAETACAAGRDAESRAMIAASRKRHGYPEG